MQFESLWDGIAPPSLFSRRVSPLIRDATHAEHPFSQTLCVPSLKPQAYVRVLDMNEHRPVFLKPLYEVRVHARSCRFSSRFRECWRNPRVGFHHGG